MDYPESGAPRRGRVGGVLLPLVVLLIGIPTAASLYIDKRWFDIIGHTEVFSTLLMTRLTLAVAVGAAVGLILWINLRLAMRLSQGLRPLHLHDPDGVPRVNLGDTAARLVVPGAVAMGILSGLFNNGNWDTWLLFLNRTEFGVQDPIFGRDVGFYVFQLPWMESASALTLWMLGLSTAGSAAVYSVRGAMSFGDGQTRMHQPARAHLSILAAAILAVLVFEAYLDTARLLFSTTGRTVGASYADVHARLPALRLKMAVAGMGVVLILASIRRENLNFAMLAAALYVAAQFGVQMYPSMVHRFSVIPNEFEKEKPYIKHNLDATRAAFGLDTVQERELSANATLSAEDIENNRSTIDNIRLWDHQELLDTFAQIQEIRTYYDFASVDNDRYIIDGKLRQTMLSPRELNSRALPNQTWVNTRFVFTHGYGLALGPVNEATPEGLPVLMVQDLPPVSSIGSLQVSQPAIYYGELSNDYVFVRTHSKEFDYPTEDDFVETQYEGKGGVRFDSDPYMVVREDGRLAWIFDAYTTSRRYPYSETTAGVNYIRNSVKGVVDAYDGTVTLYAADDQDPILATWRKIFPDTFVPLSEMPADLRAHLRYPETIFKVQSQAFEVYHMRDAQLLYNREDQWEIPATTGGSDGTSRRQMEPYYTVMRLPGEKKPEFIQMLPFTPKGKENMAAWLVARADGDALGEKIVYRFPKDRLVFGPQQVVNRINQDAEVSRQISLWDQRGSKAILGTLLVIPIEESLIYVRPLYLRSEGGKIPELKRVIVAYGKKIAMEPSLEAAMAKIFGQRNPAAELPAPPLAAAGRTAGAAAATTEAAATAASAPEDHSSAAEVRALNHFERAVEAQRSGQWARYGEELRRVEALLRRMQPKPGPAPADMPTAEPAPQPMQRQPAAAGPAAGPTPGDTPSEAPAP